MGIVFQIPTTMLTVCNMSSIEQFDICVKMIISKEQQNFFKKGDKPMNCTPIKDLNKHRTGDISEDGKVITIIRGNCKTTITANPDGTLHYECELIAA